MRSPKLRLAVSGTKRFFTGEAAAEKYLNKMARKKILDQDKKWIPKAISESRQNDIRNARKMRSAASKAELE